MVLLLLGFISCVYLASLALYRLVLSPVASFPGPKLAALTFWYEFYYDVLLRGQYTWKIQQLHKQYGPIVRINPEELHIDDTSFYDQVYVGPSRRTEKWPWSAQMFGTSMAAVGTVDHDTHRQRRAALNPFFSKKSVTQLEPIIQKNIDLLCERLNDFAGLEQPVNLSDAFACLSADVISDCAFGESYGKLTSLNFAPEWREFMMELSLGTHLMKQFGWLYRMIMALSPSILAFVHPLSRKLSNLRHNLASQIEVIRRSNHGKKEQSHRTFFHSLLNGDLPPIEKSTTRLTDEALTIIGAGTVTTAHTLAITLFHILSKPDIMGKLQQELLHASSKPGSTLDWNTLSQLPYLAATINEGLRLAFGVSHRLQRVSPDSDLHYKQWRIPAGTPVSQTQMFIMLDPEIFPEPSQFIPERWISSDLPAGFPEAHVAKRFFVPFSRGTRSCVGMNLAYAELFLTIGTLLRPVELGGRTKLEVYKTSEVDMACAYDWFNPCPPIGSKGLRVKVCRVDPVLS